MNILLGFNESVLEALMRKAEAMYDRDCNVALAFEEMTIKQDLVYNEESDTFEGFEDFSHIGQTRYIANHAVVYGLGACFKMETTKGLFPKLRTMRSPNVQSLTQICLGKLDKTGLKVVALVFDQGSNSRSFL